MIEEQKVDSGSVKPAFCQAPCYGHVPFSHGSLFSGIGGFDLAAEWMGWTNVFQIEKDEWCRKVLAKNFPETKRYADIKEFNAKEYEGTIDIISGGFPCQPFSIAGNRKGKDDDRYLWQEMLRVISAIQPPFVVCENVPGIIGLALDTVLIDLEAQGYTTETFVIPACSKNAPHKRERVWIIAYTNFDDDRRNNNCRELQSKTNKNEGKAQKKNRQRMRSGFSDVCKNVTNTNGSRQQEQRFSIKNKNGEIRPQLGVECGNWWEVEPGMDRVVDGFPGRVDRLKGLGNAIVPQVAYEIFKVLGCVRRHCP